MGGGGRVEGCNQGQFDLSIDFASILSAVCKTHWTPTAARPSKAAYGQIINQKIHLRSQKTSSSMQASLPAYWVGFTRSGRTDGVRVAVNDMLPSFTAQSQMKEGKRGWEWVCPNRKWQRTSKRWQRSRKYKPVWGKWSAAVRSTGTWKWLRCLTELLNTPMRSSKFR